MTQTDCTEIIDHLGLVAGMCEELGIAETIEQATRKPLLCALPSLDLS